MGMQLTLPKESNRLYCDFVNAYWKIKEIQYSTTQALIVLCCYPTREASQMELHDVPVPSIGFGSCGNETILPELYRWDAIVAIAEVFPDGIPLDENLQKTTLYNWIKSYTNLPFHDIFED